MDAPVYYERIEDSYFTSGSWVAKRMPGQLYHDILRDQEKARGEWLDKEQYPRIKQETIDSVLAVTPEELESFKDEYIQVWSPVGYDAHDGLFLTAHY